MQEQKNRIFSLDFIKVIAVFMIIIFHFLAEVEDCNLLYDPNIYRVGNISLLNLGGVNLTLGNYGASLLYISSGMSLMYAYQHKMDIKNFYRKRFLAIYPLYYIAFIMASFFQIFMGYRLNNRPQLWTLVWTVLGIDKWIGELTPTYGLIGDALLGCLIYIYILFPVLYKYMNEYPHMVMGTYTLIFLVWEYVYPFAFPKACSIVLRTFEVLLGMYFIKRDKKVTWLGALISELLLGIIFIIRMSCISSYLLASIAGMSLTVFLYYKVKKIKNGAIQRIIFWLKQYTFPVFLIHHFLLKVILKNIPKRSLKIGSMLTLFLVYMAVTWLAGIMIKKTEQNLMNDSMIKKVFGYQ